MALFLDHDQRYAVTDQFLHVWRRLMAGETVNYAGRHIEIADGKLLYPPLQKPYPPLYFGGSSDAGQRIAAEHVDVYLTWGEPPAEVAAKIAQMREAAAAKGRRCPTASAFMSSCAKRKAPHGTPPTA